MDTICGLDLMTPELDAIRIELRQPGPRHRNNVAKSIQREAIAVPVAEAAELAPEKVARRRQLGDKTLGIAPRNQRPTTEIEGLLDGSSEDDVVRCVDRKTACETTSEQADIHAAEQFAPEPAAGGAELLNP